MITYIDNRINLSKVHKYTGPKGFVVGFDKQYDK